MLIDKLSGELVLGGESFLPHMDIVQFKRTKAGVDSKLSVDNAPWQNYRVSFPKEALAVFYFNKNRLQMIDVGLLLDVNEAQPAWTTEELSKTKSTNDAFLQKILGFPPYLYSWGEVSSSIDKRSWSASIIIRYSN